LAWGGSGWRGGNCNAKIVNNAGVQIWP